MAEILLANVFFLIYLKFFNYFKSLEHLKANLAINILYENLIIIVLFKPILIYLLSLLLYYL